MPVENAIQKYYAVEQKHNDKNCVVWKVWNKMKCF